MTYLHNVCISIYIALESINCDFAICMYALCGSTALLLKIVVVAFLPPPHSPPPSPPKNNNRPFSHPVVSITVSCCRFDVHIHQKSICMNVTILLLVTNSSLFSHFLGWLLESLPEAKKFYAMVMMCVCVTPLLVNTIIKKS